MKISKITPEYFVDVKRSIRWMTCRRASRKHGISLKTVLQIKGSKDYHEYQAQNKAQHPDVKFSLKDEILDLHKIVFDKEDNKYRTPKTAQMAVLHLNYELSLSKKDKVSLSQ